MTPSEKIAAHIEQWKKIDEDASRGNWFVNTEKNRVLNNPDDIYQNLIISYYSEPHDCRAIVFHYNNSARHREALEKCVEALGSIECELHSDASSCGVSYCPHKAAQQALAEVASILERG